jgi:hypothetical protein
MIKKIIKFHKEIGAKKALILWIFIYIFWATVSKTVTDLNIERDTKIRTSIGVTENIPTKPYVNPATIPYEKEYWHDDLDNKESLLSESQKEIGYIPNPREVSTEESCTKALRYYTDKMIIVDYGTVKGAGTAFVKVHGVMWTYLEELHKLKLISCVSVVSIRNAVNIHDELGEKIDTIYLFGDR